MQPETTTYITDPDGLGRLPREIWAVKIRAVDPTTGRARTFIYTHERKPTARRHFDVCSKLGASQSVTLLKGAVAWEEVE